MIKAIKGTKDTLPQDIEKWYVVEEKVKEVFAFFNYHEIRTPVFEETALFARGIGEATDIVSKEMYTFTDMGGTSITLKPEMTAAVVRAYNEHSLGAQQQLNKLYYISPMFRQEKPQAGRLRQFHQFGCEALGSTSPLLDAENIIIAYRILKELGLRDITVKINTLGQPEDRVRFTKELRNYLSDKIDGMSDDSRKRFETNILRIFDSKDERDIEVMKNAPLLIDFIDEESKNDFETVKQALDTNNIPYEVEPALVRGLDYYTKTTFEIVSGKVGSQSALCGGGRYDYLVEQLGGKPTPGVGFAAGIERIILALENENALIADPPELDSYVIRLDKELTNEAFAIATQLRNIGLLVELDYLQRSVKAQMREANKLGAKHVVFIGGEEWQRGEAVIKNLETGEQKTVELKKIAAYLYL